MAVTEAASALGAWGVRLASSAPRTLTDALGYFGHIAITAGREDPRVAGDGLLSSARYVGVLRGLKFGEDGVELSGAGMAFWLGDEDGKGSVFEDPIAFTEESFTAMVRGLLPASGSVVEGTLHSASGLKTITRQYESPRQAIDYVCSLYDCEWRVNGDGTLDAGPPEDLYVTDPRAAIIRRTSGLDMGLRALPGTATVEQDVEDFTTRVVLLAQGEGETTVTSSQDINPLLNPYLDLHGNTVELTRLISESSTESTNADARAQLQLNRFTNPRDALALSDITHDLRGEAVVGDSVWVHDPDSGLFDEDNEVIFRGERLNPVKLRVTEMTWPVDKTMGVYFRTKTGEWLDLTDHVIFESGQTNITVGGYSRSLISGGGFTEPVGSRPVADTSVPDVPVFVTPFDQSIYQTDFGITRGAIHLEWTEPTNTDLTPIVDGDRYEIRFRRSSTPVDPITWSQAAAGTWGDLHTWGNPLGLSDGPWSTAFVGFDFTEYMLDDLTPGRPYEIQIRAVDNADTPHFSAWSESELVQVSGDTIEPSTPAAPTVAASLIAVQVAHSLGKSTGGTFNLEPDLDHLEVHLDTVDSFTPSESTLIGRLRASIANLAGEIKAVGTFAVSQTTAVYIKVIAVDEWGNRSNPSAAAGVTATLIDDSHVTSLTATKITAGTISVSVLVSGELTTALTGTRVRIASAGLEAYNSGGVKTVFASSADGSFTLQSASTGSRVALSSATGLECYSGSTRTVFLSNTGDFTLQSAASGARIALTPGSGLETYNSGGIRTVLLGDDGTFELKSADSGGRINLTTTGYRAYGSNGNLRVQILNDGSFKLFDTDGTTATLTADATTGDLAILGELRTGTGGRRIDIGRNSSDRSEIQMYSTNTSSSHGYAALSTREFSAETAIYLRSSLTETSYPRAELVLHPEWSRFSRQIAADNFDVGFNSSGILVAYNQVTLIHQDETTGDIASLGLGDGGLSMSGEAGALLSLGTNGIYLSGGGSGQGIQCDTNTPICNTTSGTGSARFGVDNGGPTMRFYWSGSSYQFVRTDTNTVVKTFIIDHPVDPARHLIHATTESPHNGVEYWGEAVIQGGKAVVDLPSYFEALCSPDNRQVQVSTVLPDEDMSRARGKDIEVDGLISEKVPAEEKGLPLTQGVKQVKKQMQGAPAEPEAFMLWPVAASTPRNGRFRIACAGPDGTRVAWLVKAVRKDVPPLFVEPLKTEVQVQGNGPYKFYTVPVKAPGVVRGSSK